MERGLVKGANLGIYLIHSFIFRGLILLRASPARPSYRLLQLNDLPLKGEEGAWLFFMGSSQRCLSIRTAGVGVGGEFGSLSQIIKTIVFGKLMSLGPKKLHLLVSKSTVDDLKYLMNLVVKGKVRPLIDRIYSFAETPEAVQYLSRGHALGKVVITDQAKDEGQ